MGHFLHAKAGQCSMQINSQDDGTCFIAFGNHLKKQIGLIPLQRQIADFIVLGHHGSKTSSRRGFLTAVEANDFVVSSGPKSFSGTVLPDQEVLDLITVELNGNLWRTDNQDLQCKTNPNKIGNDNDGKAGGV